MGTDNIVRVVFDAVMGKFKSDVGDGLNDAESQFSNFSNKVSGMLKVALTGFAVTKFFDVFIKGSLEVSASFEAQMSKVKAISGATAEEMERLAEVAEEMGATTKFTATEAAEGYEYMATKGWEAKQMIVGLPGLINLSAASNMDLAEATGILTGNLAAFQLEAGKAGVIADVYAYAAANSGVDVRGIGESMQYVGLSAHNMGIDIQTTTAMLGKLGNVDLGGSSAGTALNAMFTNMKDKAKKGVLKVGKELVSMIDDTGSYRNIIDIISDIEKATEGMENAQRDDALSSFLEVRGIKAMNGLLTEGSDKLREFANELYNSKDAAQKMAAIKMDNLEGDVTLLQSQFQALQKTVGDKILPHVRKGVQNLTESLGKLAKNGSIDKIANSIGEISEIVFEKLAEALEYLPDVITSVSNAFKWLAENFDKVLELVQIGITIWLAYKATMLIVSIATNPLIFALGAVIAVVIYLYTEVEAFRKAVLIGFNLLKIIVLSLAGVWINSFNGMARVMEAILGWIPLIGDALRGVVNVTQGLLDVVNKGILDSVDNINEILYGKKEVEVVVTETIEDTEPKTEDSDSLFNLPIGGPDDLSYEDDKKDKRTAFEKAKDKIDEEFQIREDLVNSKITLAEDLNDRAAKEEYENMLVELFKEKLRRYNTLNKLTADINEKRILEASKNTIQSQIITGGGAGTEFERKKSSIEDGYETREDLIDSQINLAVANKDKTAKKEYQKTLLGLLNEKLSSYTELDNLAEKNSDEKNILESTRNKLLAKIAEITNDIKGNLGELIGEFNAPSELSTLTKYTNSTNANSTFTRMISTSPECNFYLTIKDLNRDEATKARNKAIDFMNYFVSKDNIVSDGKNDVVRN